MQKREVVVARQEEREDLAILQRAILPQSAYQVLHSSSYFTSLASADHIDTRFQDIASALLNHHHLILRHNGSTTRFRVLELEFYLDFPTVHPDPFCHAHLDQALFAQWSVLFALSRFISHPDLHSSRYFHKAPRRTDLASPSFHGVCTSTPSLSVSLTSPKV